MLAQAVLLPVLLKIRRDWTEHIKWFGTHMFVLCHVGVVAVGKYYEHCVDLGISLGIVHRNESLE
jgi:hypothetical protein